MTDKLKELKTCPFCGGKAKIYSKLTYSNTYYGVVCSSCSAKFGGFATFTNIKDIANAWNRRVNNG